MLETIIKDKIRADGPISIADYMQLALQHPQYGYYITRDPFGAQGDFVTAPEISQIFGELIGLWCADLWTQRGGGPLALVELGPGRGTLMQDALRASAHVEDFHDHLTVHLVETSEALQREQFYRLGAMHERIEWVDSIEQLPDDVPLFIIANEFFDALPIRQHVMTENGLCERRVGVDESGALAFTLAPPALSLAKADGAIKHGTVIESCAVAKDMVMALAARLKAQEGAMLLIDYGYLGENHQDTLQALKNHAFHPVLKEPGLADITAHIDFNTLLDVAKKQGVATHGPVDQGKFLARLGADIRAEQLLQQASDAQAHEIISGIRRLIDPAEMGVLFKVAALLSDNETIPAGFYAARSESDFS